MPDMSGGGNLTYDKAAWHTRAQAAKAVEEARKRGDPVQVETALTAYWRVCDDSPLYSAEDVYASGS